MAQMYPWGPWNPWAGTYTYPLPYSYIDDSGILRKANHVVSIHFPHLMSTQLRPDFYVAHCHTCAEEHAHQHHLLLKSGSFQEAQHGFAPSELIFREYGDSCQSCEDESAHRPMKPTSYGSGLHGNYEGNPFEQVAAFQASKHTMPAILPADPALVERMIGADLPELPYIPFVNPYDFQPSMIQYRAASSSNFDLNPLAHDVRAENQNRLLDSMPGTDLRNLSMTSSAHSNNFSDTQSDQSSQAAITASVPDTRDSATSSETGAASVEKHELASKSPAPILAYRERPSKNTGTQTDDKFPTNAGVKGELTKSTSPGANEPRTPAQKLQASAVHDAVQDTKDIPASKALEAPTTLARGTGSNLAQAVGKDCSGTAPHKFEFTLMSFAKKKKKAAGARNVADEETMGKQTTGTDKNGTGKTSTTGVKAGPKKAHVSAPSESGIIKK